MNLPNKITVVRIVLIPFIVFFYLSTSFIACGKLIAAGLFAVACLTDFLDGYLARKLNLVTTLGKFLDSIADKMLVLGAFALVVADNTILAPYGVIAFVIVIFRELIISALRQMAASKNVVIAADMWGKVKANFQFFAILFFMAFSYFIDNPILPETLYTIFFVICYTLLALTVLSTIISGVHYFVKNKAVFASEEKIENKAKAEKETKKEA